MMSNKEVVEFVRKKIASNTKPPAVRVRLNIGGYLSGPAFQSCCIHVHIRTMSCGCILIMLCALPLLTRVFTEHNLTMSC